MIKYFINKWDKNKDKLEEYIKTHNQEDYACSYEDLLKQVIEIVFNEGNEKRPFNTSDIQTVDFGDYQGTLILTFSTCAYQPSEDETFHTVVDYGSCSGCDTLQGICWKYNEKPNEEQIKDYMTLCLHMVQKIKCFGELDEWILEDYYN
ncbi:TPA: hypothetical protein I9089_002344 [Clostridium perfringens]|uniref:hypothetical protein n=1 Tax=Clostridium perfringens TaxID=1502 RepID=UPI001A226048|nr:hypothetical protein [Clostridium perfringens]MCX0396285.1 hypothetical protein [Clostridium perfringens]HAT4302239.1 hypothetical protein [Clostridium perfringens]